jgi:chromosome partitioning protein
MRDIAAICNQKGGTGKTTLTMNLGAALAEKGQNVLILDLDPQGHLTEGVGMKHLYVQDGGNLFKRLTQPYEGIDGLIYPIPHEKMHLIPSNYEMMLAEQALYMSRNREHKLKEVFESLNGSFDWILIDCPPNLGNLTDNALNAARKVIIPIQAEQTSVRALELLFDQIDSIEQGLKIKVDVLAIVPNLVQDSALAKRILSELRASIPTIIPFEFKKRVVLQEAYEQGRSIFTYQPERTKMEAVEELRGLYLKLAQGILEAQKGGKNG